LLALTEGVIIMISPVRDLARTKERYLFQFNKRSFL
jgi:hypothetical protein